MSTSEKSLAERITEALLAIPTEEELTGSQYQSLQALGRMFADMPKADQICSFLEEVSRLAKEYSEPAALRAELTRRGHDHDLIELFLTYQRTINRSEEARARRSS